MHYTTKINTNTKGKRLTQFSYINIMIRKHKPKKSIPKKLIKQLMDSYKSTMYMDAWEQIEGKQYPELENAIHNSIGLDKESYGLVFHLFNGDIYPHVDKMDKSCYLVPLKVTDTMQFNEGEQWVNLKVGEYYSFNDFNVHGLCNPRCAYGLVASVSKDYYTSKRVYR